MTDLCQEAEPSAASLTEPTEKGGGTPTKASGSAADDMSINPASIPPMNLLAHIDRLKAEKKRLKDEKKQLNKTLKNAEKRRARLKKKARQLSNKDLQDVLQLRELEQAASQASATASAADVQKSAPEVGASADS